MRTLVTIALAAGLTGCLGYEDDIVQFEADFEECGLCDWTVSGAAEVVATNHPAEHAALLQAGTSMTTPLGIVRDGADPYGYDGDFTDGNWIEYSTDCHARPALRLVPAGGDDLDVAVELGLPSSDDFQRFRLMFPPLPGDPPGPITFRQLSVLSHSACRLDNVRIMVSGGTLGY